MKNSLFLTLLLSILSFYCHAQNRVGNTYQEIDEEFSSMGFVGTINKAKDGTHFVAYYDEQGNNLRAYFFDTTPITAESVCNIYRITQSYSDINSTIKSLNTNFVKQDEGSWIEYGPQDYLWLLSKGEKGFTLTVYQIEKTEIVK